MRPPPGAGVPGQHLGADRSDAGPDDRSVVVSGLPGPLDERLSYWGFDHAAHRGELIVNASAAADMTLAFGQLFAARFPIRQLRVAEDFGGDDERSMRGRQRFRVQLPAGSRAPASGPSAAMAWRSISTRSRIRRSRTARRTRRPPRLGGSVTLQPGDDQRAGTPPGVPSALSGGPGGAWRSLKDYMHFSANGL